MIKQYRKKPIIVEAVQWTGNNEEEVFNFCPVARFFPKSMSSSCGKIIAIDTLKGTMLAFVGDYIIKGIAGEFYPRKPEVLEQTYEEVIQGETK